MLRALSRTAYTFATTLNRLKPTSKINPFYQKLIIGTGIGICIFQISNPTNAIEDKEIEKVKKQMNRAINEFKSKYGDTTVYPPINYNLRGNTYTIEFQVDQRKCNLFMLLTIFFSHYSTEGNSYRVCDLKSMVKGDVTTWYIDFEEKDPKWKTPQKGRLTISGIYTNERPNFRIILEKDDFITDKNIEALKQSYHEAVKPKQTIEFAQNLGPLGRNQKNPAIKSQQKLPQNELYKKLTQFGVTIFDPNDKTVDLDWDFLAGYQNQKRSIEDTILLALNYPQIYDEITEQTRMKYEPNRPKAILFEGPPGTGKTTSAKIISQQVNIPLIYIPIQAIMSEFYGKSEQKLSEMWQICKKLGKVIIFIDEIDALAGNRSTDMHEASRRILSTLLRKIDSFQSTTNVMLICATNRKQDLDPAMLSRIDMSIAFNLPDLQSRAAIFRRYAKHLSDQNRQMLAEQTQGFSGRNISDICKHAQRKWASKLIRQQVKQKLPDLAEYIITLHERKVANLT